MSDVSKFTLDNAEINVKDSTARTTANNAATLASTASGNATTALNKVTELEKLSRLTATYDSSTETIKLVTTAHGVD